MKMRMLFVLSMACVVLGLGVANAQDGPYQITKHLPGMTEAVVVHTGAPAGFDPITAAAEELHLYGYPRRPDPSNEKAYASWAKAVACQRIDGELVQNPTRFHRPVKNLLATGNVNGTTTDYTSGNWSGYALYGGTGKFDEVVAFWLVPNVGSEPGGPDSGAFNGYSSTWVGIDGDGVSDLIQDGTESDWSSNGSTRYDAWIEMLPASEVVIANFPVQPGDLIYATSTVSVASGGAVTGEYYLANYNTHLSVSASIKMPTSVSYHGVSAEWIMERTDVNGTYENPMPHYAYAYLDNAYAYRQGSSSSISYLSEANQNITMVDPDNRNAVLSDAYEQDGDSLWFQWKAYK